MEIREVKIEEYWPLIVKNTEEFGQIAVAENPEFNKLAGCIYQVLQDSFVRDATEYSVGRWENMLDLTPENGDTLDDRKARILTCLNIKLPYTVRVLRQMLIGLLGEDNFTMNINNDTATLTVAVSLDTTESQIAEVESLLDHVLPRNLVTEISEVPMGYTMLDYLESTGNQYLIVDEPFIPRESGVEIKATKTAYSLSKILWGLYGDGKGDACTGAPTVKDFWGSPMGEYVALDFFASNTPVNKPVSYTEPFMASVNWLGERKIRLTQGANKYEASDDYYKDCINYPKQGLFAAFNINNNKGVEISKKFRIHNARFSQVGVQTRNLLPMLDPTGTPCMVDMVTRCKPFYNSGTGDFTYPGAEQAIQTLDLDFEAKNYAQLTEHGVRRLYHVPKGYTGTKDDYAAEHGFKELVEPPMPMTGYWMPEWRETETQLILDWVETEAPIEVTEND